jgi:CHASE2 domain-containing sensor protein/signal transduction histidine kinase
MPAARRSGARRLRRVHLILLLCVTLTSAVLAQRDWLWRWDLILYDASLPLLSSEPAADVVIVGVDEDSLSRLGRWPWSRRTHAELVGILSEAGARVILLDMIFAEPDREDPGADTALASVLEASGRVVLPVILEQPRVRGQLLEQLPIPVLASAAARLGHAHAELDADGLARSTFLLEGLGSPRWPALALAMLWVGEPERLPDRDRLQAEMERDSAQRAWVRSHHVLVPFVGKPGRIARVSYADVLSGRVAPDAFRDAYVLVGVTATGLGDILPTPVSGHAQPMPGVEFNANLLHALRGEGAVSRLPQSWRVLLCVLLVALPVMAFIRTGPRTALLLTVAGVVVAMLLAAGVLLLGRVWIAPAPALVGILASYPLWSWLRLESAMRFLIRESRRAEARSQALARSGETDIAAAVDQLVSLLPVDGWVLEEASGRELARGGEPPPAGAQLPSGRWQVGGDVLSVGLGHGGERHGLRARLREPLDQRRLRLLDDFCRQHTGVGDVDVEDSLELVQAQIVRMQHANDQLDQLRSVVDDTLAQMADAVLVSDSTATVRFANPRAGDYLLGDAARNVVGMMLKQVLADTVPEGSPGWQEVLPAVLLGREPHTVTVRHGSGRDLLVDLIPIEGGDVVAGGVIVSATDISDWKERERRREEMLSFLSHDLRSPLISMLALLELNRSRGRWPDAGTLATMERHTRTTLHLAEQFLELVRAESSEELPRSEVDMIDVASNAVDQVWARAQARQVVIARDFAVEEAWLQADASLLERAIANLLVNAIVHNPPGTHVRLALACEGDALRVEVSDDGRGIPADSQARVFQRFQRSPAGGDARKQARGSGLGLAFVDVVCRRHGARISLDSVEGRGSRFVLLFPGGRCEPLQG